MIPVVADSASVQARNGDNQLALHPMAKPAQLVTRVLLDCPRSGDLLLDCFLGSGTPLLNLTGHDGSALLTANFSEIEAGKEDGDERQSKGSFTREPPKDTRFRKGKSGNPNGRPKGQIPIPIPDENCNRSTIKKSSSWSAANANACRRQNRKSSEIGLEA